MSGISVDGNIELLPHQSGTFDPHRTERRFGAFATRALPRMPAPLNTGRRDQIF
jgi:hypothetical protein